VPVLSCDVRIAITLVLALLLGAADQYLGSLSAHPWGADVSGLSAPWLVLPFIAGAAQVTPRKACLCGGIATLLALIGYCLMTLSPVENAHLSTDGIRSFVRAGNWRWFAGGLVTGPVAGWLGHRWRHDRLAVAGVAAAAALVLEPVVRMRAGFAVRSTAVAAAEVLAGLCAAVAAVRIGRKGIASGR
jgi:hypothetical protein